MCVPMWEVPTFNPSVLTAAMFPLRLLGTRPRRPPSLFPRHFPSRQQQARLPLPRLPARLQAQHPVTVLFRQARKLALVWVSRRVRSSSSQAQ